MTSDPITIAHLITELNMGGAEQMLRKLVYSMDRRKFHSIVVSMTDRGPIGEKIIGDGIPVFALGMGLGRPTLAGLAKLYHLLKQQSADILQTWLYHADLLGFIVGRLAEVRRVVWGIRCSDMHFREYRPMTALTVRLCGVLSSLVDAIVVNSHQGRRIHRNRGYQTERMVLIPNGFNTELYRPDASAKNWLLGQLGLPRDLTLIGLIARFDQMKDQGTFLKAASLLVQRDRSVHFLMVGRGVVPDNPQLSPLLEDHMKGRVHLLGLRDDIPRLTAAMDIASSSSAFGEGFSNTIGEAMSCGVPCVVTDVGDSAYIVGNTGFVVPPEDPPALADAWYTLINMGGEKREELGRKARLRIIEDFEIGKTVKQFESLYEALTENDEQ